MGLRNTGVAVAGQAPGWSFAFFTFLADVNPVHFFFFNLVHFYRQTVSWVTICRVDVF